MMNTQIATEYVLKPNRTMANMSMWLTCLLIGTVKFT